MISLWHETISPHPQPDSDFVGAPLSLWFHPETATMVLVGFYPDLPMNEASDLHLQRPSRLDSGGSVPIPATVHSAVFVLPKLTLSAGWPYKRADVISKPHLVHKVFENVPYSVDRVDVTLVMEQLAEQAALPRAAH